MNSQKKVCAKTRIQKSFRVCAYANIRMRPTVLQCQHHITKSDCGLLVGTDQVSDGGQIDSRTVVEHFPSVMLRENRDKNVADVGAVRQLQTLKPFVDVDVRW